MQICRLFPWHLARERFGQVLTAHLQVQELFEASIGSVKRRYTWAPSQGPWAGPLRALEPIQGKCKPALLLCLACQFGGWLAVCNLTDSFGATALPRWMSINAGRHSLDVQGWCCCQLDWSRRPLQMQQPQRSLLHSERRQACGMDVLAAIQWHQGGTCLAPCRLIMNGDLCLHRLFLLAIMRKPSAGSNAAHALQFMAIQKGDAAPDLRSKSQCRQWIVKSLWCCRHDGVWQQ